MDFTLKDLIYISVYVATGVALLTRDRSTIKQHGKSMETIKNIIFLDKGGLNIVDNAKCNEHRNVVHRSIRREAEITHDALDQIQGLNENVITIMLHMNLKPITIKPRKRNS